MGSFQKARQRDPWTAFWDNYIIGGITMLSSFCLSVIHTIHYLIHNREDRMNKNYQKDKVTYTSSPLYRSHKCFMHSGPLLYTWATGSLINNKYTHIFPVEISDNSIYKFFSSEAWAICRPISYYNISKEIETNTFTEIRWQTHNSSFYIKYHYLKVPFFRKCDSCFNSPNLTKKFQKTILSLKFEIPASEFIGLKLWFECTYNLKIKSWNLSKKFCLIFVF